MNARQEDPSEAKLEYTNLPGIYELERIESDKDGTPIAETARPGMFTFTRDGRLSVVSASDLMVMAYTGSYRIENDALKIDVESCVYREMEGKTITRKILSIDDSHLVLEAVSTKSTERSVLTWKKKLPL
jgi:hypothetical protein